MYKPPEQIKSSPLVKKIISATFPEHKGRKFYLSTSIPKSLDSYWDGGSRDFYGFYDLQTGKTLNVGSNHPFYEKDKPRQLSYLPSGAVLVKRSCFCGKWLSVTFYVNESDIIRLLPAS